MLTGILMLVCLMAFDGAGTVVLDRVAIAVGRRAIKASDIERDLRLTAFLNGAALTINAGAKRGAAERLIDQQLIRNEIATGQYPRASESDAKALLEQIRTSRFGGSDARLKAALTRYGITEGQLQDQLSWQLTVLRFIDNRFRPGVNVSDEDLHKYYDKNLAELKRQNPRENSFEELEPQMRETLEGEQTNKQFEEWLAAERKTARIEYHQEAFE